MSGLPCEHGRPDWRMCPHCLGISRGVNQPAAAAVQDCRTGLIAPLEDRIATLEAELAEARERERWIDVRERLPEKYHPVDTFGTSGVDTNCHDGTQWLEWRVTDSGIEAWQPVDFQITHWRERPAPPEVSQ